MQPNLLKDAKKDAKKPKIVSLKSRVRLMTPGGANPAPKSREILMFVCLQKDATNAVTPQSLVVFIVLVNDWRR